jgi:hypothetical protein
MGMTSPLYVHSLHLCTEWGKVSTVRSAKIKVKLHKQVMNTYRWQRGKVSHILDLSSRYRWVVSFTLQLVYPQGLCPCYPLDRRLSGPQNLFNVTSKRKLIASSRNQTPVIQPVVSYFNEWAIPALWYLYRCTQIHVETKSNLKKGNSENLRISQLLLSVKPNEHTITSLSCFTGFLTCTYIGALR